LIYKRFWMLLRNKYQSKPKLRSFLRKEFYINGRLIQSGKSTLLRTADILPSARLSLCQIVSNKISKKVSF
jgi:hypothetical protein